MAGMLIRIVLAVALVLATWNPAGVSYAQWALVDTGAFNAGKALVGALGVAIVCAVIGAFVWWLSSIGLVATDQRTFTWIVLVAVGIVLGIGMGWSLVRSKATGQVETD
jgi:hypothetical protein